MPLLSSPVIWLCVSNSNTSYTSCRIWVYYPTIVVFQLGFSDTGDRRSSEWMTGIVSFLCAILPNSEVGPTTVSAQRRPVLSVPISQFRVVLSRNKQVIRLLVESENMNWEWVYVNHISYKIKRTLLVQDVSHLMLLQNSPAPWHVDSVVLVWAAK